MEPNIFTSKLPTSIPDDYTTFYRKEGKNVISDNTWETNSPDPTGWGETFPRLVFSGETPVISFPKENSRIQHVLENVHTPGELVTYIHKNKSWINRSPVAFAAIESVLLDCFAREKGGPIESIFGMNMQNKPVVSTVMPDLDGISFRILYALNRLRNTAGYKLKISGDPKRDMKKLKLFPADGKTKIYLDASNLWKDPRDVEAYLSQIPFRPFAIEDPLQSRNLIELKKLSVDIPIVLNKTFTDISILDLLKDSPQKWILNYQISRLGGLIRSLKIFKKAHVMGIPGILGSRMDESVILNRTTESFWNLTGGSLLFMEENHNQRILPGGPFHKVFRNRI